MADIEPDLHEADRRLFRLISDGATCQHVPGTGTDRLVTVVVHGDWDHGRVQQLRVHGYLDEGGGLTGKARRALRPDGTPGRRFLREVRQVSGLRRYGAGGDGERPSAPGTADGVPHAAAR
jgi:hypothetical protein